MSYTPDESEKRVIAWLQYRDAAFRDLRRRRTRTFYSVGEVLNWREKQGTKP